MKILWRSHEDKITFKAIEKNRYGNKITNLLYAFQIFAEVWQNTSLKHPIALNFHHSNSIQIHTTFVKTMRSAIPFLNASSTWVTTEAILPMAARGFLGAADGVISK